MTKQWFPVRRKQTIIDNSDLEAWFTAVHGLENETVRDYLLFVCLTGCRKTEGLQLKIKNVNLKERTLLFPDTKTGKPLHLPISNYLYKVLKARIEYLKAAADPADKLHSQFVFPGIGPEGHLKEPKRWVQRVIERSGVKFTLHDLRRVFITTADSLDLSATAVKLLVNHSVGSDVTAGYVVSNAERLRKPMQRIEDTILKHAKMNQSGKILKLNRGA